MNYKTYQYPKFQKSVFLVLFIVSVLVAATTIILPTLALIGVIKGEANLSAMPLGVLIGIGLVVGAFIINMLMPDIRVRDDYFQLKTLFYESQWLKWEEIIFIKKHFLSRKEHKSFGIRIDNIHPIYSFIGRNQQIEGPGFVLTHKIQDYDELIQVLEEKRPDLLKSIKKPSWWEPTFFSDEEIF